MSKKKAETPCPSCGHCPTCGKTNAPVYQFPYQWPYYYLPYPYTNFQPSYWTVTSGGNSFGSVDNLGSTVTNGLTSSVGVTYTGSAS